MAPAPLAQRPRICGVVILEGRGEPMVIRPFRAAEVPAIRALVTGILAREYPDAQAAYPANDLDHLEAVYDGPRNTMLVAEADGRVIGTCGVKGEDTTTALLRRLFVDPAYRGRGVGAELVKAAIAACRRQGYRQVQIRTSDRMRAAIAVCLALGFREEQRVRLGAIELVQLSLSLSP